MLEYRTVQYSLSINSLTHFSGGYERFKIKRYSPGTVFGIRARGEERKVGKGGDKKGPEIRPREISFESFSLTGFPFCKTLFELEHEVGILGPVCIKIKKSQMSRIFLSMCDVKIFLTFTSPNMVLL
jgi:hypothetical protein